MGTVEFTNAKFADSIAARISAVRADLRRIEAQSNSNKEIEEAIDINKYLDIYERIFEIRGYVQIRLYATEFAKLLALLDKLESENSGLYR